MMEPAINMSVSRQQAYLEAMDIAVWSLRERPIPETSVRGDVSRLKLGPGNSGVLLICAADTDSAGRLANDINRALGGNPVWAWSSYDDSAIDLKDSVSENLFTTVAFFGGGLASQFFDGDVPAHLDSAKLVVLPSMKDIEKRAEARQALWARICESGMLENG
jgi:DNA polymerase III psi subunit